MEKTKITMNTRALLLLCTLSLFGCKAPTVNLGTSEPIKVDINMRLDVYQYSNNKASTGQTPPKPGPATEDPGARRRNRMADIQTFKNNALIGENREGFVSIQSAPEGEYGEYVRKTVEAENDDRLAQMKDLAETRKVSLPEIQKEQAALWRNRAFKGELIEVEIEKDVWKWTAKEK